MLRYAVYFGEIEVANFVMGIHAMKFARDTFNAREKGMLYCSIKVVNKETGHIPVYYEEVKE